LNKIDKLRNQLNKIESEILQLENFRATQFVRRFRRQLEGEKSVILEKIKQLTSTEKEKEEAKKKRLEIANRNRSSKNKRTARYIKAIQRNYRPDLSYGQIRTLLKKRRQGLETDIPDVAWRNPSP
jgi:hemerythrin-like domain-containing protein